MNRAVSTLHRSHGMEGCDSFYIFAPGSFRRGKIGSKNEKIILNLDEMLFQQSLLVVSENQAQMRIQLVNSSVGLNSESVLSDSLSPMERGFSAVAGFRIDLQGGYAFELEC